MTEQLPNSPLRVRMQHTTLAEEILVDPLAVPHHENAGWQVVPGQDIDYERWPADLQRFEGQQQVRMHHPNVADDIIVGESAVPFHRSKGWLVSDPEVAVQLEGDQGLQTKTLDELKELARSRDLPVSGTKAELIERLTEQDSDQPAAPASQESEE